MFGSNVRGFFAWSLIRPAGRTLEHRFPKRDYNRTQKQRVFGLTTSTGKVLSFLVPKPWTTQAWAAEFKAKVVPFLKRSFPRKKTFQILLDGEKLLRGPAAKAAMTEAGVTILPNWPSYSPDLNPQDWVLYDITDALICMRCVQDFPWFSASCCYF